MEKDPKTNEEANSVEKYITFANALEKIPEPANIYVVDSDNDTRFRGSCDAILSDDEVALLKGILSVCEPVSTEQLALPLEISAQFGDIDMTNLGGDRNTRVLILSCGTTNKWKLQYKVFIDTNNEPYVCFEGKDRKPCSIAKTPNIDLLFFTVRDLLSDCLKDISHFQELGISRIRRSYR